MEQIDPRAVLPSHMIGRVEPTPQTPDDLRETVEEARERAERALRVRRNVYRVPARFTDASLHDLNDTQDPAVVSGWWDSGARTLLIVSPTKGNGKSHAAYAIGNRVVVDPGVMVVAWSAIDLNDAIRPNGDEFAFVVACSADLLIIDDLGGERLTEWTMERMQGLIDARWRDNLRTIVTTNLTGDQAMDRYGERIMDRLIDNSRTAVFTGPGRRAPAPW